MAGCRVSSSHEDTINFQDKRKTEGKARIDQMEERQAEQDRDKIKALADSLEAEIRSLLSEQKRDQLKREEVR